MKKILNSNAITLYMYSKEVESLFKKTGVGVGDDVEVNSESGSFEGVLMPRPEVGDNSILVLKLKSGYNMGINLGSIKEIFLVNKGKREFSFPQSDAKQKKDLATIGMIYTGGTIGSKVDYVTGGVHMLIKPGELLHEVPELSDIANIEINQPMAIASEDMTHIEWGKMAQETAKMLNDGMRGVVITHGTDTMHYSSAALSFMLDNLNAPVVFTGAQRSSDRGSSDAFMNLICAARVATSSDIAEVGICMHETSSDDNCTFIRGTKARKMHTSRRDAFKAVNNVPICKVGRDGRIEYLSKHAQIVEEETKKVVANTKFEDKVAIVKAYPNSDPDIVDYYAGKKYKGLIIEGTGLGHAPVSPSSSKGSWIDPIKRAVDAGMIVGMTSQCLYGRVNETVYRNLRLLREAGVVYCEDMMPEVAYVKLGFLLGNQSAQKAKELLGTNIKGEITKRSEILF